MNNTNITNTTYNTRSEARQAAWAAGYRCKRRDDLDVMSSPDGHIRMIDVNGGVSWKGIQ